MSEDRRASEEGDAEPAPGSAGEAAPNKLEELIELLRGAIADLQAMREHALTLLRIRADRAQLSLRKAGFLIALGLLIGTAALGALATAGALIVLGLAGGLTQLLGVPTWMGALISGASVLASLTLIVLFARRIAMRRFGRELEERYKAKEEQAR